MSLINGTYSRVCSLLKQDGSGNNDSFFRARQSNAGFRASVFANPMVRALTLPLSSVYVFLSNPMISLCCPSCPSSGTLAEPRRSLLVPLPRLFASLFR